MELYDKIVATVKSSTFDVVIVIGADNYAYMAGASIPFLALYPDSPVALIWPRRGDPTIIAPEEWEETIVALSSVKKAVTYNGGFDDFAKRFVSVVAQLGRIPDARFSVGGLEAPGNAGVSDLEPSLWSGFGQGRRETGGSKTQTHRLA